MTNDHSSEDRRRAFTDNAGGGVRGLRARPSVELLKAVSDAYGIRCLEGSIDLGGSSNLNLLVTDKDSRYVVRVYRPYVNAARITDIQLVRSKLNEGGVPCSETLPTKDGQYWIDFDDRLVEVERYVESDSIMDSWERLEKGLPMLGRIHTILRDVEVGIEGRNPFFANHVEPQRALSSSLQGIERIRGWDHPSLGDLSLADAAEELSHLVSRGERAFPLLPRQLVHGDYWHNNVFFLDGRVVLVTDFDFMGERARIDDLALTLYFADSEFSDDPASDDRIRRLRSLVDAYDNRLDNRLSSAERAALPLAIARQPLWSIGGWIALLDDEEAARQHAAGMNRQVECALNIVHELDRWQEAFSETSMEN